MNFIKEKVKYFLEKYNILPEESTILVAFSGGYDSMCLLDVLSGIFKNIIAIHLNHNWRGEESDREEYACKSFCTEKDIKFYSEKLSGEITKTETAAREARYDFFRRCSEKFNSKIIFTAHNANDNAETILYRIAKGTGTNGLIGISEKRDIFYRPLLDIKRSEIVEYCKKGKLTPNNDSSNEDTKYKRNFIRKNIIPLIQEINPEAIDAINSLSEIAINDRIIINEYLTSLKDPFITKHFIKYSQALQLQLLYNLFYENDIDYDKNRINIALNFIKENWESKSGKTMSVDKTNLLFVNNKNIKLIANEEKEDIFINIEKCGKYKVGNKTFSIEKTSEYVKIFPKDEELTAYVDLSDYDHLELRTRQNGDIIRPLGCCGKQKLKKYLNEKKIPKHEKDKLIFLTCGNEILWVPSIGLSENIKVKTNPTHIIKLDMES